MNLYTKRHARRRAARVSHTGAFIAQVKYWLEPNKDNWTAYIAARDMGRQA